jgi:hypothetical protein
MAKRKGRSHILTERVSLKISRQMLKAIQELAHRELRSMNMQIIHLILTGLRHEGITVDPPGRQAWSPPSDDPDDEPF